MASMAASHVHVRVYVHVRVRVRIRVHVLVHVDVNCWLLRFESQWRIGRKPKLKFVLSLLQILSLLLRLLHLSLLPLCGFCIFFFYFYFLSLCLSARFLTLIGFGSRGSSFCCLLRLLPLAFQQPSPAAIPAHPP